MARIKIEDLPQTRELTPEEMAELAGAGIQFKPSVEQLGERNLMAASLLAPGSELLAQAMPTVAGEQSVPVVEGIEILVESAPGALETTELPLPSSSVVGESDLDAAFLGLADEWVIDAPLLYGANAPGFTVTTGVPTIGSLPVDAVTTTGTLNPADGDLGGAGGMMAPPMAPMATPITPPAPAVVVSSPAFEVPEGTVHVLASGDEGYTAAESPDSLGSWLATMIEMEIDGTEPQTSDATQDTTIASRSSQVDAAIRLAHEALLQDALNNPLYAELLAKYGTFDVDLSPQELSSLGLVAPPPAYLRGLPDDAMMGALRAYPFVSLTTTAYDEYGYGYTTQAQPFGTPLTGAEIQARLRQVFNVPAGEVVLPAGNQKENMLRAYGVQDPYLLAWARFQDMSWDSRSPDIDRPDMQPIDPNSVDWNWVESERARVQKSINRVVAEREAVSTEWQALGGRHLNRAELQRYWHLSHRFSQLSEQLGRLLDEMNELMKLVPEPLPADSEPAPIVDEHGVPIRNSRGEYVYEAPDGTQMAKADIDRINSRDDGFEIWTTRIAFQQTKENASQLPADQRAALSELEKLLDKSPELFKLPNGAYPTSAEEMQQVVADILKFHPDWLNATPQSWLAPGADESPLFTDPGPAPAWLKPGGEESKLFDDNDAPPAWLASGAEESKLFDDNDASPTWLTPKAEDDPLFTSPTPGPEVPKTVSDQTGVQQYGDLLDQETQAKADAIFDQIDQNPNAWDSVPIGTPDTASWLAPGGADAGLFTDPAKGQQSAAGVNSGSFANDVIDQVKTNGWLTPGAENDPLFTASTMDSLALALGIPLDDAWQKAGDGDKWARITPLLDALHIPANSLEEAFRQVTIRQAALDPNVPIPEGLTGNDLATFNNIRATGSENLTFIPTVPAIAPGSEDASLFGDAPATTPTGGSAPGTLLEQADRFAESVFAGAGNIYDKLLQSADNLTNAVQQTVEGVRDSVIALGAGLVGDTQGQKKANAAAQIHFGDGTVQAVDLAEKFSSSLIINTILEPIKYGATVGAMEATRLGLELLSFTPGISDELRNAYKAEAQMAYDQGSRELVDFAAELSQNPTGMLAKGFEAAVQFASDTLDAAARGDGATLGTNAGLIVATAIDIHGVVHDLKSLGHVEWLGKATSEAPAIRVVTESNAPKSHVPAASEVHSEPAYNPVTSRLATPETSGMTPGHFEAFRQVAQSEGQVIIVRETNPNSTQWIDKNFPPKPLEVKVKTDPQTGLVTAISEKDIEAVREARVPDAPGESYYIVSADGRTAINSSGHSINLSNADWPIEPGQVIHPTQHKPLTADYDLLGVIDPANPGQNLVLVSANGQTLSNWSNPHVAGVADQLNAAMGQKQVMHGAHDGSPLDLESAKSAVVFYPDGSTVRLDSPEHITAFYESIGREPITGGKVAQPDAAMQSAIIEESVVIREQGGLKVLEGGQSKPARETLVESTTDGTPTTAAQNGGVPDTGSGSAPSNPGQFFGMSFDDYMKKIQETLDASATFLDKSYVEQWRSQLKEINGYIDQDVRVLYNPTTGTFEDLGSRSFNCTADAVCVDVMLGGHRVAAIPLPSGVMDDLERLGESIYTSQESMLIDIGQITGHRHEIITVGSMDDIVAHAKNATTTVNDNPLVGATTTVDGQPPRGVIFITRDNGESHVINYVKTPTNVYFLDGQLDLIAPAEFADPLFHNAAKIEIVPTNYGSLKKLTPEESVAKGDGNDLDGKDGSTFGGDSSPTEAASSESAGEIAAPMSNSVERDVSLPAAEVDWDNYDLDAVSQDELQSILTGVLKDRSSPPLSDVPTNLPALPHVDPTTLPPIWTETPPPLSNGEPVTIYRGFSRNAEKHSAQVVRPQDVAGSGVLSRDVAIAHDAVFNAAGREAVVSGPTKGGVVEMVIPADVWDELVRTNSISERRYGGYSGGFESTEIRVNTPEAAEVINKHAQRVLKADPTYEQAWHSQPKRSESPTVPAEAIREEPGVVQQAGRDAAEAARQAEREARDAAAQARRDEADAQKAEREAKRLQQQSEAEARKASRRDASADQDSRKETKKDRQ